MVVLKQRRVSGEVFWPKIVLKKWLNLKSKDLDFDADEDEDDGSDIDDQGWPDFPLHGRHPSASSWSSAAERSLLFPTSHFLSRFFSENCGCDNGDGARRPADGGAQITDEILESAPYKLRRTNSETLRAQYINTKELRCVVRSVSATRPRILRFD
jgi:hypothetical protein